MLFSVKNGRLPLDGGHMDYIRFGTGGKALIMLPGLGDGLRTVRGTALPMAWMYRCFSRAFTVYMLSRREPLSKDASIADMADDLKLAMDALGIEKADILGVSMGGMIAQQLAIRHPEKVNRLILTVTCPCPNDILTESVTEWMDLARKGDHSAFMDSNMRRLYSDSYYRHSRWMVPLLGTLTKPRSYDRFLVQAQACLNHDSLAELPGIQVPTLVIGGKADKALGCEASRILADRIPGAQLKIYENQGHSLYEEAPDFNRIVLNFLMKASDPSGV